MRREKCSNEIVWDLSVLESLSNTSILYTHPFSPVLFSERVAVENEDLRQQDHFDGAVKRKF